MALTSTVRAAATEQAEAEAAWAMASATRGRERGRGGSSYLVLSLSQLLLGELKGARRKGRDLRAKVAACSQPLSPAGWVAADSAVTTGGPGLQARGLEGTYDRFLPKLLKSMVAMGRQAEGPWAMGGSVGGRMGRGCCVEGGRRETRSGQTQTGCLLAARGVAVARWREGPRWAGRAGKLRARLRAGRPPASSTRPPVGGSALRVSA